MSLSPPKSTPTSKIYNFNSELIELREALSYLDHISWQDTVKYKQYYINLCIEAKEYKNAEIFITQVIETKLLHQEKQEIVELYELKSQCLLKMGKIESIVNPVVAIALRTYGHLLLGVVKIYSRKAKYVLADANEALTRIKLQVIPDTKVDLPEKNTIATYASITLPEKSSSITFLLPEVEMGDIDHNRLVDFGDVTIEDFDTWETAMDTQKQEKTPSEKTPSERSVERGRDADIIQDLGDDIQQQILGDVFNPTPGKLSIGGPSPREMEGGASPRLEAPDFEIQLEETTDVQPVKKRKLVVKGNLIIDQEIIISSSLYKKQLKDSNDILRVRKNVVRKEDAPVTFNTLLFTPNISNLSPNFVEKYSKRQIRTDLNVEAQRQAQPEIGYEEGPQEFGVPSPRHEDHDFGGVEVPIEGPERSPSPALEMREETPKRSRKEMTPQEKEKKKIEKQERDALGKQYKGLGVTDKTLKVIAQLNESFKEEESLSLNTMLEGRSKAVASKYFFELLTLKSKDIIDLDQKEAYGDIIISKTEKFV